jgi:uncharacterized membrane protein
VIKFLGFFVCLGGVVLGLYLGAYLCLVGGIIQVIQSATPTVHADGVAWGVLRVLAAGPIGWISFWLCAVVGIAMMTEG